MTTGPNPQIGVGSSWNEITPCNMSLQRLAQAVKAGVHTGGGYPLEFGTISVSDGISMGHEGMHFSLVSREVIADSVETVMQAERLDGSVLLAGCDKSIPGMLMAAARLEPGQRLPLQRLDHAGPGQADRRHARRKSPSSTPSRRSARARGADVARGRRHHRARHLPGEGACGGMYTANTMASAAEALGMSLPGSASPVAIDKRRDEYAPPVR